MGNMLTIGVQWLSEQLKAHASHEVTYVRGVQRLPLSATIGQTAFEIDELGGIRVEHSDRDYIVTAADLVIDGRVVEPDRGDTIEESVGSETHVYEVMAPGSIQPYKLDATGTLLRIHAKKVKVV